MTREEKTFSTMPNTEDVKSIKQRKKREKAPAHIAKVIAK